MWMRRVRQDGGTFSAGLGGQEASRQLSNGSERRHNNVQCGAGKRGREGVGEGNCKKWVPGGSRGGVLFFHKLDVFFKIKSWKKVTEQRSTAAQPGSQSTVTTKAGPGFSTALFMQIKHIQTQ